MDTKTCTRCSITKSTKDFRPDKRYRGGVSTWCWECLREYGREYRKKNGERMRERYREWYRENRESVLGKIAEYRSCPEVKAARSASGKAYYQANKEDISKRHAEYYSGYYEANREKRLAARAQWVKEHPEDARRWCRRRRAKQNNADGSHTPQDIRDQYNAQNGLCYWCMCEVGSKYHVDHVVPLSRGGSDYPSNLVISCPHCNCSKKDRLPSEWAREWTVCW